MKTKITFLIPLLIVLGINAYGQYFPKSEGTKQTEIEKGMITLTASKTPAKRLDALLFLANAYLFKPAEERVDIDSAILLANQAKKLSRLLKDLKAFDEAVRIITGCYYEGNQHAKMLPQVKELSAESQIKMLTYWGDRYFYISYSYKPMHLIYLDTAWTFYKQKLLVSKTLKNDAHIKSSLGHLEHLVRICYEQRDTKRAAEQSDWIKQNTRSLHIPFPSCLMSAMLAEQYVFQGNYEKALECALYAAKLLNNHSSDDERFWVYGQMGQIYRFMGKHDKSNIYYIKLIDMADHYPVVQVYTMAYFVCYNYLQLQQTDKAINYLATLQKRYKPKNEQDQIYLYRTLAENYKQTKQPEAALKNWIAAKDLSEKTGRGVAVMYINMGALLNDMGRYREADEAYEQCERTATDQHVGFMASLYHLRSQVKAVLGDHKSALFYLEKNKKMTDSIYTVSKEKHTQELDIQYETQKKEAQLKQRAEEIKFLNREKLLQLQNAGLQLVKLKQAEQLAVNDKAILKLRDRDLKLKTKDLRSVSQIADLQRQQLQQADIIRKVTFATIFLLLIVIGLIFWQFRQKRKSSQIVLEKNQQLSKLLGEKEWLLKEVHHRVKNNLQTIVNLLESQSDHLEEPAFTAIETSKNRIFAMSLIHHKLYLSEETSKIDMRIYINELVCFLRDTVSGSPVVFNIDADPIKLDAGRAIPIGLIINEAVTNSLKHAFKDKPGGRVNVSFKLNDEHHATLAIADDGYGSPQTLTAEQPKTMGLKLIRGLARQLDATLAIDTANGTTFIVSGISMTEPLYAH